MNIELYVVAYLTFGIMLICIAERIYDDEYQAFYFNLVRAAIWPICLLNDAFCFIKYRIKYRKYSRKEPSHD